LNIAAPDLLAQPAVLATTEAVLSETARDEGQQQRASKLLSSSARSQAFHSARKPRSFQANV